MHLYPLRGFNAEQQNADQGRKTRKIPSLIPARPVCTDLSCYGYTWQGVASSQYQDRSMSPRPSRSKYQNQDYHDHVE